MLFCERYFCKKYKEVTNEGIALLNDVRSKFWDKERVRVQDRLERHISIGMVHRHCDSPSPALALPSARNVWPAQLYKSTKTTTTTTTTTTTALQCTIPTYFV